MSPTLSDSSALDPTLLNGALLVAAVLYGLALVLALARPRWGRPALAAGVLVHLGATVARGLAISFFPLTNKLESFSTFALATALVTLALYRPVRRFVVLPLLIATAALAVALTFPRGLSYPPPLMMTVWYPLHVPLSFLAYGTWVAAAAAGLAWFVDGDRAWLGRVDRYALWGFGLWSASMIFGGLWGVVAWGAYFMWDAKIVWSVILWFHYASFVHVKYAPSLRGRPWVRPTLAWMGLVWVFVAYVGTSFFFGGSSHAFS